MSKLNNKTIEDGNKQRFIKKHRQGKADIGKLMLLFIIAIGITVYILNNSEKKVVGEHLIRGTNILLVNRNYLLSDDYESKELVEVNIEFLSESTEEEHYMTKKSAKALEDMVEGASREGVYLTGVSGYRSYATQKNLYNYNVQTQGKSYSDKYVAKPGASEHQTGEAMDIGTSNGWIFEGCGEAIWLQNNSYKYGFIVRYQEGKEDITGYDYEPWHVRYVGKDAAKEIFNNNLTLEDYAKIQR